MCPVPPGCAGYGTCQSRGTFWEIQKLIRDRHDWATAPTGALLSDDQRATELAQIADALDIARAALRARRDPWGADGWNYTAEVDRAARTVTRVFLRHSPEARANLAASHRVGHRQRTEPGRFVYVHPARPGVSFPSRGLAAHAAVDAQVLAVLLWWLLWLDRAADPWAAVLG